MGPPDRSTSVRLVLTGIRHSTLLALTPTDLRNFEGSSCCTGKVGSLSVSLPTRRLNKSPSANGLSDRVLCRAQTPIFLAGQMTSACMLCAASGRDADGGTQRCPVPFESRPHGACLLVRCTGKKHQERSSVIASLLSRFPAFDGDASMAHGGCAWLAVMMMARACLLCQTHLCPNTRDACAYVVEC